MASFRTFSHLNAEEYLLVNRIALYRELLKALRTARDRTVDKPKQVSGSRVLSQFTEIFYVLAKNDGWRNTKTGLEREGVYARIHLPIARGAVSFGPLFGEPLWNYSVHEMDVGVEILPSLVDGVAKRSRRIRGRCADGFHRSVALLRHVGRNVPPVPLLLIGISL